MTSNELLLPTREALAAAHVEWLFAYARAEVEAGCSRLGAFKGSLPLYFCEVTADWTVEDRYLLMLARIKDNQMRTSGVDLTPDERRVDQRFQLPIYGWHVDGRPAVEFEWTSFVTQFGPRRSLVDIEKLPAARRDDALGRGEFKVNKTLLRKTMAEALRPVVGTLGNLRGGMWEAWVPVSGFTFRTVLDFGARRPTQARYWHELWRGVSPEGGRPPLLPDSRDAVVQNNSLCSIIGWPESAWCFLTDADIPSAAELLARLCREFLDAIPGIVKRAREMDEARLH